MECRSIRERRNWNAIRALLMAVAMCVLGPLSSVGLGAGEIHVWGGKLAWTGKLPIGWVGGNARTIESVMAVTNDANLRKILREMLLDAQTLDVYVSHLDVTGVTTQTLSTIRANIVPPQQDFQPSDKAHRQEFWQSYAFGLQVDSVPGSATAVVGDLATTTAGRPAYQATFKTTRPDGVVYYIVHLVQLEGGRWHLFQVQADSKKFRARRVDFQNLLNSVRYK